MKKHLAFLAVLTLSLRLASFSAFAQSGTLDISFSDDGRQITDWGSLDDGFSVAVQSDGKIVVAGTSAIAGTSDFAVARYNSDGTLDNTFGSGGKQLTAIGTREDFGFSVAVQSDGKIVVAGASNNGLNVDIAIVRYNSNGTLDNTFSDDGMLTIPIGGASQDYARSAVVQSDGKIVVAGSSGADIAVVRCNSDGTLDNTFNSIGIQITDLGKIDAAHSVAIQPDGKIVVAGVYSDNGVSDDFALVRYNVDGSLDDSFAGNGMQTTDFGSGVDGAVAVAIQSDGKIIAAGRSENTSNTSVAVARYNSDGALDNTFGGDGKTTTAWGSSAQGYAVVVQSDGKIVVAGAADDETPTDFILIRYRADGMLDNTFSEDGIQTTDFGSSYDRGHSVAIQSDGKIVVAGVSGNGLVNDFAVARYNNSIAGTNVADNERAELKICPNPFSGQTILQTSNNLQNGTLVVYNFFGQSVQEIKHISGETIVLSRNNLATGIYFFRLTENNTTVAAEQLTVID